ncbi:OsmC family protein [Ferrovibrio sp.]|uniref:OsmC family protein n=1 Tax=Ferrovibrio sp. TaxID=1917215 RepID=UPI003D0B9410
MDADALRAMQAPLKQQYRDTPEAAIITLKAEGHVDDQAIACRIDTARAVAVAGLHPATGGSGMELCSGDMLLEALVACAGVTLKAVSTAIGVTLKDAKVVAEGDLDFRGTLGVAKDAPVGFAAIRLRFEIDTDASEEQVAQLIKLTERYCVVFQTIAAKPQLDVSVKRAA